jgi:hypothetical protein
MTEAVTNRNEAVGQNNGQCNAIKMTDHYLSFRNHYFIFAICRSLSVLRILMQSEGESQMIKRDVQNANDQKGCPDPNQQKRETRDKH